SRIITRALADHFKDNPHVIGWQTDNEFHCHFAEDHSAAAQTAFVEFLRAKFNDDIAALNRTWGTAFWTQTYDRFEDIPTPIAYRPTHPNPAHILDYHRFLDHGVTVFQREQVDILREANSTWFVTHNGCFKSIDYHGDFSRDLDFLSFDSYPFFKYAPDARAADHAFNLDYVRSYAGNFIVMEQQSGPGGQDAYLHDNPEPGELRRMAYASIAHGADGLLLFRERSCPFGAEQYWCGVLDHDNIPRRRYHEAARLGAEMKRVGPAVTGTRVHIDVAVSGGDFTALHAHLPISHGLPNPRQAAEGVHRFFHQHGYAVGCVHPDDSLAGVMLYVLTHYTTFDPAWPSALADWVASGGTLVIGARTGTKDTDNNVVTISAPGVLTELAGVTVSEYGRQNVPEARPLNLRVSASDELTTHLWYEQLEPAAGTEVIASWTTRHLAGTPAITRRVHGKGAVYYVGTYFSDALLSALVTHWTVRNELPAAANLPAGVEQVIRQGPAHRLTFLINHQDTAVTVPNVPAGHNLVTDLPVFGPLCLQPHDVAVIRA
ncbi:MAG: beta-galactosidase, partial [Rariglobus sp.]